MDVLIDWDGIPWDKEETRPGIRYKVCVRDGQQVDCSEYSEGFVKEGWCTEGHLVQVVEGEASLRFKDGRLLRLRAGDTGIIRAGEAEAHRMELAAGERIVILGFEQS